MTVTFTEGNIEIDNTELLNDRADINKDETFKGARGGLGSLKGSEEDKLKTDIKSNGWHEPNKKKTDVLHICPICGTHYFGRPNKTYCNDSCKNVAKMRRYRKRKNDIRNFKPYRGKTGEINFILNGKIEFIPAIHTINKLRCYDYIEECYPNDYKEITKQVKEMFK